MNILIHDPVKLADEFKQTYDLIKAEIQKVVIGQEDIIDLLLISLFSRGHCVLVGVPGLAKTLLIKTLADSLNLSFSRIQFTPDLMPGDITGTELIEENVNKGSKKFKARFKNLCLQQSMITSSLLTALRWPRSKVI